MCVRVLSFADGAGNWNVFVGVGTSKRITVINVMESPRRASCESVGYERRISGNNPCLYYTLAQRAYLAERPTESLELVAQAIRLHRSDHRFHHLEGEVHDLLGDTVAANESHERARGLARAEKDRDRRRSLQEHYPRATVFTLGGSSSS